MWRWPQSVVYSGGYFGSITLRRVVSATYAMHHDEHLPFGMSQQWQRLSFKSKLFRCARGSECHAAIH
jgi:hypothetical protein